MIAEADRLSLQICMGRENVYHFVMQDINALLNHQIKYFFGLPYLQLMHLLDNILYEHITKCSNR